MLSKRIILLSLLFINAYYGWAQIGFPVPAGNENQLFYLQRNVNTNTIVYELNYKNGVLHRDKPVNPYWIRYQENGQREELSYIQRRFAYGLKSKKIRENHYELSFVSYIKFKMYLEPGDDKKFYVFAYINRKKVILTSVFLKINGGSVWSPNIEYVEIHGIEPGTRSVVKEKLKV